MMHEIIHVLEHSLLDTLKLVPFLFLTYLLMEFIEHKTSDKVKKIVHKSGKAIKISAIVSGVLLFGNALFVTTISNFNIGILPVALLGAVLFAYGMLFEKLRSIKIINTLLALGLSVVLAFGSFLAIYGRLDNADYSEKTVILLKW